MSSKIFSKKPIKPIDKVGIDKYNVGNLKNKEEITLCLITNLKHYRYT